MAIHGMEAIHAFAEQHGHDTARERAVGAEAWDDLDIGLLHGVVVVDGVDRRDFLRATFAPFGRASRASSH